MARKLALAALVALIAALTAGWLSARAGDPADGEPAPLTLHLEADSRVCTAGSFTEVRWEISGGVEPYEATLNGQSVEAPSGGVTIACGAALDIPDWLRLIVVAASDRCGVAGQGCERRCGSRTPDASGCTTVSRSRCPPVCKVRRRSVFEARR